MSVVGKVLVIDDSEMVLERVKARLQRESYEVATTSQPVGAARHLLLCDLVILDFHMPGMNGGEVLRSLKMLGASSGATPLYSGCGVSPQLLGAVSVLEIGASRSSVPRSEVEAILIQ